MVKQKKHQHFIPQSYLKAWCDIDTPNGQEPYIWLFQKDSIVGKRKAPENIFHENEMYTIFEKDGGRHLGLEDGLASLEQKFSDLRKKLALLEVMQIEEHALLCCFVAAMHARTRSQLDHLSKQWQRPLELMKELDERMKAATPAERKQMSSVFSSSSSGDTSSLDMRQVEAMVERPAQTIMPAMIKTVAPLLTKLDLAILCTNEPRGFITSDHPCVWFDSQAYRRPPMYRSPALCYKSTEISFPISPNQCLVLNQLGMVGYMNANLIAVEEINRRTRFHSHKHYVVNQHSTNDLWFKHSEEPSDSWEKTHKNS